MLNATIFRLPSTELTSILSGKKLILPFPCLSLMGAEVVARFGLTGPDNEPLIPRRIYIDRFDPIRVLRYWPFNAEAVAETEVLLPKHIIHLHANSTMAKDETDHLSTAARDLMTAIVEYQAKFIVKQNRPDGTVSETEKPSTSDRQEQYKGYVRGNVQKAFLNYQFRQLQELKRVLKKQVFQTVHPGCFAPLVPDPSLAINQVRIPAEIWEAFRGKHALVLRHPVLDVLYRLKPEKGSDMAIGLHPLLFARLNADVDGDMLFVTPLPEHLDGGQVFIDPDYLVYDEANVLSKQLTGHAKHQPVDVPPLNLHDFGPSSEFASFVAANNMRNFKNAVWSPMDDEKYFAESMAAAARFRWEKDSIGRADWVRRTLEVLTDDVDNLRSINRFCSVVSQKAIDAGKHRDNFPLDAYMRCFRCRFEVMGANGPYLERFATAADMATELVTLTGLSELYDDALKVSDMLFGWPEFPEIGMQGLVERYYPWWALVSKKRTTTEEGKMLFEARVLLNQDSAIPGLANLMW